MMHKVDKQKRKWLSLGGIVLGASVLPNSVLAMVSTPKPRILTFRNINTGERLSGEFSAQKGFASATLKKLDHFMRDKRTNQVHRMDPNLFHKFYNIQSNLGLRNAEIEVICGYRSAATNAMRHRQSSGVASNSYHIKGKAIDFIIADHHRPSEQVPDAIAVLDPQQADCPYPYKELCGCGLGFKLAQAYHEYLQRPFSELISLLDLVAVATAADIVPMNGENRCLTYFGLEVLNNNPSAGVKALFGEHQGKITITDVVFKAAPRVNAAGRIEHGKYAVALLTETDEEQAVLKAKEIDALNTHRKELDSSIAAEALNQIEANGEQEHYTSVVFNEEWHKGVIGIVASRLIEHYYRPTVVFTKSGNKYAASARSVQGFDIYEALEQCSEYLEQFGGHKYAAGLTLRPEQYPLFKNAFEEVVKQTIDSSLRIPKLFIDTALPLSKLTQKLYNVLKQFEPFGPLNLPPLFYAENVIDTGFAKRIGKDEEHLKLTLKEVGTTSYYDAVGFGLAHKLPIVTSGRPFSIVYSIEENQWNGRASLQLQIRDIK